ncbi:MAG: PIF1 family DEAD/DEAH box helicase [Candidatus Levyibacteriota bacterium]
MTQNEALDMLKLGHNVFLTGPAGSGKTYLLNQYIAYLKLHKVSVGITASTGIAATHMGGTTIHSWVGMGIRDSMSEPEIRELLKRPYLRNRLARTKVLIIDEISMLHAHRLDLVNIICQIFKGNSAPFGGMQVIMCGDFFQLPPVSKQPRQPELVSGSPNHQDEMLRQAQHDKKSEFVTESESWKDMRLQICYLEEQHRQDDRSFLRVLNDIRNNEVSEMTVEYLSERLDKDTQGYVRPTRLFTHNADVDAINQKHLEELTGESHEYMMSWRGSYGLTEILKKSCLAPEVLTLKKGAQVMFVKNNYEVGYVNGTLGEVIDFVNDPEFPEGKQKLPIVRTFDGVEIRVGRADWSVKEDDEEKAALSQLPLRLAWAITVHKSQGMSLDAAEIDLSRSFLPGMGYVALSRVRSLSGLKLMGMNQMALQINPDVSEMDREFLAQSNEGVLYLTGLDKGKKTQMQLDFLTFLKGN